MQSLFNVNGLAFWDDHEIAVREMSRDYFDRKMRGIIRGINPAVEMLRVESPTIMPRSLLNPNYTSEDIWEFEVYNRETGAVEPTEFTMRAETTPGSYVYARHLLDSNRVKPPFCVYQFGKSYRREDEHPSKYVRLREFYQMEWQWVYTSDTANDYHSAVLEPVRDMIRDMVGLPCRVTPSDRLPSYSEVTTDVEALVEDRWMELASVSRRTDFPGTAVFQGKKGVSEKPLLNVEVAIGMDRCVYAFDRRNEKTGS